MFGTRWLARIGCTFLLLLSCATAARADLVVVANQNAGTLSIIRTEDGQELENFSLDVGPRPHNMTATPGGKFVIVTHLSDLVSIVDPRAPAVLRQFAFPGRPHGVAANRRWAAVSSESDRTVRVLDLRRMQFVREFQVEPYPHNLALTGNGRLWITEQFSESLWLVELRDGRIVHRLDTPASPHDLAMAPRGGGLWVTNWGSTQVFLVHGEPPQLDSVQISGSQPHHVVVTPNGREAWVSNHGSEDISVIDTRARREVTRINVGDAPHHVVFSRNGRLAYVANGGSQDVSVVEVATRREIGRLSAGAHPHGIAVVPDFFRLQPRRPGLAPRPGRTKIRRN